MLERRGFLSGLGAVALASTIPVSVPPCFDAEGYLRDLRRAGHRVYLFQPGDGSEWLGIGSYSGLGLGSAYSAVSARWRAAMDADPDHVDRVVDFLRAELA